MGLGPRFGSQHNCSHQEWPAIRPRSFIYFFGLCLFQSVRKSINVKIWGPWNALQVLPLSATASNNFPQKQQLAPSCLQGKSTNGTAGKQLFWQMHVPLQIVRRWPFKKSKVWTTPRFVQKWGASTVFVIPSKIPKCGSGGSRIFGQTLLQNQLVTFWIFLIGKIWQVRKPCHNYNFHSSILNCWICFHSSPEF